MQGHKGFSLVELMVVISIIVILISFILPVVNGAGQTVQTVQCAVKLKQIHQAMTIWALDHKKKYPASRQGSADSWVGWGWDDQSKSKVTDYALWNYMNNDFDAYICPTFLDIYQEVYGADRQPSFTYSMNEYIGNGWLGKAPLNYMETIPNPDSLHMLGDENFWKIPSLSNYIINNGAMGVGRYNDPNHHIDCLGAFHNTPGGDISNGYSNICFVDGHVSLHHVSESKELVTPKHFKN